MSIIGYTKAKLDTLLGGKADLVSGAVPDAQLPARLGDDALRVAYGLVVKVDAYPSPQAAVDAAPAGATVLFVGGQTYPLSAPLTVSKSLTLRSLGGRATLAQTTAGQAVIRVTASDVTLDGLHLLGKQNAAYSNAERGVDANGASAAAPIGGLRLRDLLIERIGGHGVWIKWATDVQIDRITVQDVVYSGVLLLSVIGGRVTDSTVRRVSQIGNVNSYGFAATRATTDSLVTDPRSQDITFSRCVVEDVALWEGFDSHAGQNIVFELCRATRCKYGFSAVACPNTAGVDTWAPRDVRLVSCTADSGKTDGSAGSGIRIVGAGSAPGVVTEYATGSVTDCIVRGHGDQSNGNDGGLLLYYTQGLRVSGLTGVECSPAVVTAYHSNVDLDVRGVVGIDPWSTTVASVGVLAVRSTYNTGIVDGVTAVRATKVATRVLDFGVRNYTSDATVALEVGVLRCDAAATPLMDAGPRGQLRLRALKLGFYGVAPVARAASPGTATGTDAAVINSVVTALRNVGLVT